MNPKIKEIMKEMGKTQFGAALKVFLQDKENDLRKIEDCKTLEEVHGRTFAIQLIKDINTAMDDNKVASKSKPSYD